ncbi:hypothetical protein [Nocardioides sp.]|uniref:hypothetical protein n=1 Tax=Nocardioides sp. TaxID=35761 RepID=UPI0035146FCA
MRRSLPWALAGLLAPLALAVPAQAAGEPDTRILMGPATGERTGTATFDFEAVPDSPGATFECALDGGAYAPCDSPHRVGDLADGEHTFLVRAIVDGVTDPTPEPYIWTVDLPPTVTVKTAPPATTTATEATFEFLSDEPDAVFRCRLDGGAEFDCTSPYTTTVGIGGHSFEVVAIGAQRGTPVERTWEVLGPPTTTINSGPASPSTSTTEIFLFSSDRADATFECSLDSAPFTACTSPTTYTGLAPGQHTFAVRASSGGLTDATPDTLSWTLIGAGPPTTTIGSGPLNNTTARTASFTFSSTDATATFECSLDGGTYAACTSPKAYADLTVGEHTFRVRAVNATGADETPATYTWTIISTTPPDTTAPDTRIAGPTKVRKGAKATFTLSSPDADVASYRCSLDGAAFKACTARTVLSGLKVGKHTLRAVAVDRAGNTDRTPAVRTFTVTTK